MYYTLKVFLQYWHISVKFCCIPLYSSDAPKILQAPSLVTTHNTTHTISHSPISQNTPRLFSYVKKIGGNLSSKLVRTKELALGKRFGKTKQLNVNIEIVNVVK